MIQIYHNSRCSKSLLALQELENSSKPFEIIYYLEMPPDRLQLEELLKKLKIKPFDLIQKSEEIYTTNYADKMLSDLEWIDVMLKYPMLIERPIVVSGNKAIIARPAEKIHDIL